MDNKTVEGGVINGSVDNVSNPSTVLATYEWIRNEMDADEIPPPRYPH